MRTNRVTFNEAAHEYKNQEGSKYTSATTLISKFKQPFDTVAVSTAYARKHGNTPEYWQAKWADISAKACAKGTAFHKLKEDIMLNSAAIIQEEKAIPVQKITSFTEPNIDYALLPDGVYPELLMWNHYWHIAGLADIVTIDGDYFDIDDYKTNKKIDQASFKHPKTGYKMMKYPLSHVMDCNFMHYSLQISLYAFMLEQLTGKQARNLCFHHHPPQLHNPDLVTEEGICYNVRYMKKEVLAMLYMYTGKPVPKEQMFERKLKK